jgi:mono/diheme cytochrome c family protein
MEVIVRTVTAILAASLSVALVVTAAALTQTPDRKPADLVIGSLAGRDLFNFYCASCHGIDGKGKGRVAPALKTQPPDLTQLTQHNGGTYPASKVEEVIRGETRTPAPAHGSSDMPVWGPIFRGLDSRKEVNDARIENLVKHIESIQATVKAD